jgi:hypothetical protein
MRITNPPIEVSFAPIFIECEQEEHRNDKNRRKPDYD